MRHFLKVADGIDVRAVNAELDAHPELWDEHPNRTYEGSPHHGVSDLWLRFRPFRELTRDESYLEPHFAEFYPAWSLLPALKPIVRQLMALEYPDGFPVYLGGMLITRIPPGGSVKPHNDRGSWHAETMNTKVYVGLKSNPDCVNFCEDERITIGVGEAVMFNNLLTHSVENNGETERVTLICCFRSER